MSRRENEMASLRQYLRQIGEHRPRAAGREGADVPAGGRNGGTPDLDTLVLSNLAFVVKIAHDYRNMGLPFEDLVSEGNVGLVEAAQRYDPERGTKFITYAVWWVRKAILKAIAQQTMLIRIPEYRMKKVRDVRRAEACLTRSLGRRPARSEVSSFLNRPVAAVDAILLARPRSMSLDDPIGRDGAPMHEVLTDENSIDPETLLLRTEGRSLLRAALRILTVKERDIVRKRIGSERHRPMTLTEIGASIGLTRERVRQIETQALAKLRRALTSLSRPPLFRFGGRRGAASPARMTSRPFTSREC